MIYGGRRLPNFLPAMKMKIYVGGGKRDKEDKKYV